MLQSKEPPTRTSSTVAPPAVAPSPSTLAGVSVAAPLALRPASAALHVIEPRGPGLVARVRELWTYRSLLRYFIITSLRFSYKATALQWVWLVMRPLAPVIFATFILHKLGGVTADNLPYPLFFLAGSAIFQLFEESLIWITRSFQIHRGIMKRLYFPRLLAVAGSGAPGVAEFLVLIGVIGVFGLGFYLWEGVLHLTLGVHSLYVVAAVFLAFLFAMGLGLFTSVFGSEQRDIRFALRYTCRFWWFLTPIMYPVSFVPVDWRWTLMLNPMAPVVELFRMGLYRSANELDPQAFAVSMAIIVSTFLAGLWFFYRQESRIIDRL